MNFSREYLGEGIYLNFANTDRFKTDNLTLYFILPLKKENLAVYSLLPEVLRMGCRAYPSPRVLACRLQEMYDTSLSVCQYHMGDHKVLSFSVDMLAAPYLPDKQSLLADVSAFLFELLCRPLQVDGGFSDDYVSLRKTALADAVRSLVNKKSAYALSRCRAHMCEGELAADLPYGKEEDILSVRDEALISAYEDLFRIARIECYFEGQASNVRVKEALQFLLRARKEYHAPITTAAISGKKTKITLPNRVTEKMSAKQGRLVLGLTYPTVHSSADDAAFAVMLEVLAYSPVSKLFMRVREARGLCYSCSASHDPFRGQVFLIAGIDNDRCAEAERAMMAQVRQIGRGRFSSSEFEAAKIGICSTLKSLEDTPDSLELRMLRRHLLGLSEKEGDASDLTGQLAAIEAVSKKEVARAARSLSLHTVYFLHATGDCLEEEGDD